MSILYRVVDFGKAETPVFHGVKRYQKRTFFNHKISKQKSKKVEKILIFFVATVSFTTSLSKSPDCNSIPLEAIIIS